MSPFAIGRVLVLSTIRIRVQTPVNTEDQTPHQNTRGRKAGRGSPTPLSKFRSHISLIVHPAPRITNAPIPKRLRYVKGVVTGRLSAYDAIVIDQAATGPFRHDSEIPVSGEDDALHG